MPLWVFFLMVLTLSGGCHCSSHSPTLRMPRYADAIFTNSYRKVLGQLSARKLLQDIMSRQQAERNQEQGAKVWLGRQVDSTWEDQKQMTMESILAALSQKLRLKARGFSELKFTETAGRGLEAAMAIVPPPAQLLQIPGNHWWAWENIKQENSQE